MIAIDILKSIFNKKDKIPVFEYRPGTERFRLPEQVKNELDTPDNISRLKDINQPKKTENNLNMSVENKMFKVKFTYQEKEYMFSQNKSIIENAEDFGIELKYSCSMGGCGSCRIKMLSGNVQMKNDNCLTEEELSEGYILACISHIQEDTVLEI